MRSSAIRGRKAVSRKMRDPSEELDSQSDSEPFEQPLKKGQATSRDKKKASNAKRTHSDEEEEGSSPKRKRTAKQKAQHPFKGPSIEEDNGEESDIAIKVNEEGEKYVDLGKKRRATVRVFKGTIFLDIREYYGSEGDEKPGKKGVTLNQEQWEKLKEAQGAVDILFKKAKK